MNFAKRRTAILPVAITILTGRKQGSNNTSIDNGCSDGGVGQPMPLDTKHLGLRAMATLSWKGHKIWD